METAIKIATLINSGVAILFFIVAIIFILKLMKVLKIFKKISNPIKKIGDVLGDAHDSLKVRLMLIEDAIDEIILLIQNFKGGLKKGIMGLISKLFMK